MRRFAILFLKLAVTFIGIPVFSAPYGELRSEIDVLGLPLFHFIAKKVDPPIGLMGLIIIFASLVTTVFAALLQRLLQEAIHIKSENDLTV